MVRSDARTLAGELRVEAAQKPQLAQSARTEAQVRPVA